MTRKGGRGRGSLDQLTLDDWFLLPEPPAPAAGSLDYAAELCATLSAALKESPLSRAEVAARMSDLTGAAISEDMLNAWTSKSHDRHRFPFEYAAAFEVATSSSALQQLLTNKRGSLLLIGKQALDAREALIDQKIERLKAERASLRRSRGHA